MTVVLVAVAGVAAMTAAYLVGVRRRREALVEVEHGDLSTLALAGAFALGLAVALVDGPVAGDRAWSPWLVVVGGAVFVVGVVLRVSARRNLARFFSARLRTTEDQVLITTGIHRRVRHPAYLGSVLVAVGLAAVLGSLLGVLVMGVGCLVALGLRIRREEALLRARFGDEFEDYARRTKRLVPGIY